MKLGIVPRIKEATTCHNKHRSHYGKLDGVISLSLFSTLCLAIRRYSLLAFISSGCCPSVFTGHICHPRGHVIHDHLPILQQSMTMKRQEREREDNINIFIQAIPIMDTKDKDYTASAPSESLAFGRAL
jgi:hypothetical protein